MNKLKSSLEAVEKFHARVKEVQALEEEVKAKEFNELVKEVKATKKQLIADLENELSVPSVFVFTDRDRVDMISFQRAEALVTHSRTAKDLIAIVSEFKDYHIRTIASNRAMTLSSKEQKEFKDYLESQLEASDLVEADTILSNLKNTTISLGSETV